MNEKHEFKVVLVLATIQFCHIVDFVIMMPLGPVFIKEFGINSAQFAGLVSSYNYAAVVSGLLFSIIMDKFPRKTLLQFSFMGFIIGTVFCGLSSGFLQLLFSRIITGLFGGVLGSIVFSITSDFVPFKRRGKAMGILMSSFSIASIIGVPLGLAVSDVSKWSNSFYFIAFIAFLTWILAQVKIPSVIKKTEKFPPSYYLKRILTILKNKEYLKGYGLIFLTTFSGFLVIPFLSPYAVSNIGIKTFELKYMYLTGGAFTVLSANLIGRLTDKVGAFKSYRYLMFISIIPILIYTNIPKISFYEYLLLGTIFMMGVSGRMVPGMTIVTQVPKEEDRGSYLSINTAMRSFGSATSSLVGGLIIQESSNGQLLHFNYVGILSSLVILMAIYLSTKVVLSKD